VVEGVLPSPASKIQLDGKDVGEITSVASLPLASGERMVALGYLRREAASPGKQLSAEGAKLTITSIPFAEVFTN
jgi:glycine cleavage system aminomethyltransferase T